MVLNLLRAKCLSVLLYGVESCPLLAPDKRSVEFTVTRSFMKLLQTGSVAVVNDSEKKCFSFFRLLVKSIFVRPNFYRNLLQTITLFADYLVSKLR